MQDKVPCSADKENFKEGILSVQTNSVFLMYTSKSFFATIHKCSLQKVLQTPACAGHVSGFAQLGSGKSQAANT